jgi:toxin ParE1/3/4
MAGDRGGENTVSTGEPGYETRQRKPKSLKIDFHPKASDELIDAARFYERRETGLGNRFLDAVESSLAILKRNPEIGFSDDIGRRRWLVHRFPYIIIYRIDGDIIHILAVAHTSRKPGYWKQRDAGKCQ